MFDKFGKEFKVNIADLVLARELIQEIYDYIENKQSKNKQK
jgi:hypothetical protein